MKIYGLNKTTLLDYPGHVAAAVFLGGCNCRCPFCQNGDLVLRPESQAEIGEEELFAFLKKRKGILSGVCITGGEPTLEKELGELAGKIKEMGYLVKLDTNGLRPEVVGELLEDGLLDYIAMDVKNSMERYGETVGSSPINTICWPSISAARQTGDSSRAVPSLLIMALPGGYAENTMKNSMERYGETVGLEKIDVGKIRETIDLMMASGIDYEFRTTVVKELHGKKDIEAIGEEIRGAKAYFLQSYQESQGVIAPVFHSYSREEMEELAEAVRPFVPGAQVRG